MDHRVCGVARRCWWRWQRPIGEQYASHGAHLPLHRTTWKGESSTISLSEPPAVASVYSITCRGQHSSSERYIPACRYSTGTLPRSALETPHRVRTARRGRLPINALDEAVRGVSDVTRTRLCGRRRTGTESPNSSSSYRYIPLHTVTYRYIPLHTVTWRTGKESPNSCSSMKRRWKR